MAPSFLAASPLLSHAITPFSNRARSGYILKKNELRPLFVRTEVECGILGLQPRDKAAMLVFNTKEIFLLNLHQNRVHFPAERNAFVLDPQHGHRDVTCKLAITVLDITLIYCDFSPGFVHLNYI